MSAVKGQKVFTVVLTGGPCGGKSSSLEHFTKALEGIGFSVFRAPEVPTIIINAGCPYPGNDGGEKLVVFEQALMDLQFQVEKSIKDIAASAGKPAVVVMDR